MKNLKSNLFILFLLLANEVYSLELSAPIYDAGNKYVIVTCNDGNEGVAEYNGVEWFYVINNEMMVYSNLSETAQAICSSDISRME